MKKNYLYVLALLLLIPFSVYAAVNANVVTLNATVDGNVIGFEGTTEGGSTAVMCKLYDSENEIITMLSLAVNENEFNGIFPVTENGTYKITCANYEGGTIVSKSVTVAADVEEHTVTFNTDGGSNVADQKVENGLKATRPEAPTKDGYDFDDWYEDATFTTLFDFNEPITEDVTIYAKWNEKPVEKITVSFNTNGGNEIEPIEIEVNEKIQPPEVPTKEGYTFDDWYEDATFTTRFDFDAPITENIILYANWIDNLANYTVSDDNGNLVVFKDEPEHEFHLNIFDFSSLTDEELEELEISREEYDQVFDIIIDATKDKGDLLAFYEIIVTDENDSELTETLGGNIKIKIKLTEEMKKYNKFRLIYFKDDFTTEKPIELKVEGDYLVGELEHLSNYALVGSVVENSSNPKTNDNINIWIGMFIISALGLAFSAFMSFKKKNY